ncbi:MAG TPA: hypothetical protein VHG08_08405, partial [Longimicrobium sp.]|nr:hypothetical protein [Longimicrobium sp.]
MRAKLTLNVEDLAVDSFDTTRPERTKGTVFGEQCTCYTNCTCPGCPSCDATCPATCANTCDDFTCADTCGDTCDGCTGWTECNCPMSCARTA